MERKRSGLIDLLIDSVVYHPHGPWIGLLIFAAGIVFLFSALVMQNLHYQIGIEEFIFFSLSIIFVGGGLYIVTASILEQ